MAIQVAWALPAAAVTQVELAVRRLGSALLVQVKASVDVNRQRGSSSRLEEGARCPCLESRPTGLGSGTDSECLNREEVKF